MREGREGRSDEGGRERWRREEVTCTMFALMYVYLV